RLALKNGGRELEYVFDGKEDRADIPLLLKRITDLGIGLKDLNTRQSSLEEIFVSLVSDRT
ncbi:MAG TPA: multidrug ABC transporter ATP-binding protein, partial [Candidatus Eisenbacteria bacterium]|nr:multidrug ABC transporter ATP-binding protein [Candidatus Eisenbacteria bacterium]